MANPTAGHHRLLLFISSTHTPPQQVFCPFFALFAKVEQSAPIITSLHIDGFGEGASLQRTVDVWSSHLAKR
jgi:hypothetical protein